MALDLAAEEAPLGEKTPPMGLGLGGEEPEAGPLDEFDTEATVALDPKAPMADRLMALKEAIRICAAEDEKGAKGAYAKSPKKDDGVDLAVVFGGPEKKKG